MTGTSARERRLAYFAWVAVCLIWGTTYLGIRVAIETMPPGAMSSLRWILAGVLLVIYMRVRGEPLPPTSRWSGIAFIGFLLLVVGNGGVAYAEQWVSSGLAAVLVATSPFWMAGVEACFTSGERMTARTFMGLVVGFSGIVVLVWPELTVGGGDSRLFLLGVVLIQIASLGWSVGSAYSRRHGRTDHVLGTTALQMLAGGVMLGILGAVRGEWSDLSFNARTTTALLYLATVGAIGGFVAYTYALRHLPVSFVSLYAYINPVIAVALGVLVLAEPFNLRIAIAASLVLVGVAVVRAKSTTGATRSAAEAPRRADYGAPDRIKTAVRD